ncbi:MAG: amidohydrolase family protein [Archangium sp.]|nr:amidohydrolase family protein [Archangium sp.]
MKRVTRRQLFALAIGGALYGSFRYGHTRAARAAAPSGPLSNAAKDLIAKAWQGLDPSRVLDTHVHVVGLGKGGTGCEVGERLQSVTNPMEYMKFSIYLAASGVQNLEQADAQYIERMSSLAKSQTPHGRLLLFAFDRLHDESGVAHPESSEFYTPNSYVISLAKKNPELFVPCASVHPYRADAIDELTKAAEGGCVAVKWLPNAMNIDPSSSKCDAFYDALVKLQLPLITHAGEEKAVHAEEAQRLGNPLHLRAPLRKGVKVVVAHCASLGSNPDLDAGSTAPWVDNFELFMRLMKEEQWNGLLYGEISAMTQVNRVGAPLKHLLEHPELHSRLINGSDYPLPAINALMQTGAIVKAGFLTEDERALLNEIDQHDPLLFDFVTKRTLHVGDTHFANDVFMIRPELFPKLA